ncbi:trans-aconitate 2-methyltransferase protein [Halorhabdus tiamatea SARL4B]|uniref:5-carboxymethyl uridine and 5-carboxymethyl 2-thiouridine methyltransferase n=1 Tax=Halorhabdus tiamatea SARL4B TaxID=1033806 RepID=F7PF45_9EURY|nr:class I SAM-dependent methyltransferase [Halorhabdus tiamatea]ERJ06035.1 trans-aconitate 2-methyltransferase protein [Halorhabdus tiamatea SARL4B]CCQ34404.1 5-carboxymethyl uridine and 5-carboxymethyl 2-thiouridine methyltransferase [Halorhabdus tiamatea SARL4B]
MDRSRADVRETYDHIGEHFSKTRVNAWPEVESFVADAAEVDLALDVGCGNGRHVETLQQRADQVVGVDVSRSLLDAATERVPDGRFVLGDASHLPIATDRVDLAVYIATLHHLPSREARIASLDELARVLYSGGVALVSAWSTAHDTFDTPADAETGFDTTVEWTLPGGETAPRFYHIYAPAEFRADVESSALSLDAFEVSSGNCYGTVSPASR